MRILAINVILIGLTFLLCILKSEGSRFTEKTSKGSAFNKKLQTSKHLNGIWSRIGKRAKPIDGGDYLSAFDLNI